MRPYAMVNTEPITEYGINQCIDGGDSIEIGQLAATATSFEVAGQAKKS